VSRALTLAVALALTGCATLPARPNSAAVERAQAHYDRLRGWADVLLPYVPESHARRVRFGLAAADRALAAARLAVTLQEQRAAVAEAERALAPLD
jgi:hypothetical protein